jgi:hypothetical protein
VEAARGPVESFSSIYLDWSSLSEGISTHDELVTTTGINKRTLNDLPHNGSEVVRQAKNNGRLKGLEFVHVGNGESFLLL